MAKQAEHYMGPSTTYSKGSSSSSPHSQAHWALHSCSPAHHIIICHTSRIRVPMRVPQVYCENKEAKVAGWLAVVPCWRLRLTDWLTQTLIKCVRKSLTARLYTLKYPSNRLLPNSFTYPTSAAVSSHTPNIFKQSNYVEGAWAGVGQTDYWTVWRCWHGSWRSRLRVAARCVVVGQNSFASSKGE